MKQTSEQLFTFVALYSPNLRNPADNNRFIVGLREHATILSYREHVFLLPFVVKEVRLEALAGRI